MRSTRLKAGQSRKLPIKMQKNVTMMLQQQEQMPYWKTKGWNYAKRSRKRMNGKGLGYSN